MFRCHFALRNSQPLMLILDRFDQPAPAWSHTGQQRFYAGMASSGMAVPDMCANTNEGFGRNVICRIERERPQQRKFANTTTSLFHHYTKPHPFTDSSHLFTIEILEKQL